MEEERYQNRDGIFDNKINDYVMTEDIVKLLNNSDKLIEELEQLKQSQKEFTIEKLKGLRDKICDIGYDEDYNTDYFEVVKEIDNQIKELRSTNNANR